MMPTETALVGVVTVTYNGGAVLDDFVNSLSGQQDVDLRIYVIDNASSDDSLGIVENLVKFWPVCVVANDTNVGVASGNNQGIRLAKADGCEWILLLNNDTLFDSTTVATLVSEAEEGELDLLSPLIEASEPPGTIWYAGGAISRYKGMKVDHFRMGRPMQESVQELTETGYASTCCLLVRSRVFDVVGLMDPAYFVFFDDVDFAIRAKSHGFRYWVSPTTTIVHKASSMTGGFLSPFAVHWTSRNWVLVARKHCGYMELIMFAIYVQMWTLARLLGRRDSFAVFRHRESAYLDGLRLSIGGNPPSLELSSGRE